MLSALLPKAEIGGRQLHVRFVPKAGIKDAEAPTFRLVLRMRLRCKGANQNNAPGILSLLTFNSMSVTRVALGRKRTLLNEGLDDGRAYAFRTTSGHRYDALLRF